VKILIVLRYVFILCLALPLTNMAETGIKTPGHVQALGADGLIYTGGTNEMGFFSPDAWGTLHYTSLLPQLDSVKRNFSTVNTIFATAEGIYFCTPNHLFLWNPAQKKMVTWEPSGRALPWYDVWWFHVLYFLTGFLLVFFVVQYRSRKLKYIRENLEGIIRTRTRQIEEKNGHLLAQSQKLKELNSAKSRFFANISHQFRTPLTLIMGPLEHLLATCPDQVPEKKKKYSMMIRNTQRLLRLINQLLELSRLDSGKITLQAEKIEMIGFVKGIISTFQILARQNELDLIFFTPQPAAGPTEEIFLYIDAPKMEDILGNLLINAVKFTPPGGEITVTLTPHPEGDGRFSLGWLELSVCDTGPGIPEGALLEIFDLFYQADHTREYVRQGSGIGLALCKELVELHHGLIEARNQEGKGSQFILRLPMGQGHLTAEEISSAHFHPVHPVALEKLEFKKCEFEKPASENSVTDSLARGEVYTANKNIIQIVEDNADFRQYIREALEPVYTVIEAKDGREGIEQATAVIPDLIISDIMLPYTDGYELCSHLKKDVQTSHIPIILLTARAAEENILMGFETGADDYITKPFSTPLLLARIKNLIQLRRVLQQNLFATMNQPVVKTPVSPVDTVFINNLKTVMEKNLSDPEFNVEDLCRKLVMSRPTLYRKIHALSGESPTDFIRSYRLNRALQLLERQFGSVTEVAFEVGFSSRAYFTKCFREKFKRLPSMYHHPESETA